MQQSKNPVSVEVLTIEEYLNKRQKLRKREQKGKESRKENIDDPLLLLSV